MKKNFAKGLFFLLVLVANTGIHAQWRVLSTVPNVNKTTTLYVIYFLDKEGAPQIGFAGGSEWNGVNQSAAIFKTTDRGKNWKKVYSVTVPGNLSFWDISFKDSLTGWIAGQYPYLYSTTDGGESWHQVQNFPQIRIESIYYNKISHRLFVSCWHNQCEVSTDEGLTWATFANTGGYTGFAFANDSVGICASIDAYIFTSDAGVTWNSSNERDETYWPLAINDGKQFFSITEDNGKLLRSLDKGKSWGMFSQASPIEGNTGWLGGNLKRLYYHIADRTDTTGFFMSRDTGKTWIYICGPVGGDGEHDYVHNDSIYTIQDSIVWFNPNPGAPDIRLSIDTINLGYDTLCKQINFKDTLHSGCGFFDVISANLLDTSILSFSIDSLPFTVTDQDSKILFMHFRAKELTTKPYSTILKITFKQNSSTLVTYIPVIILGVTIDPNQFFSASYILNSLCKPTNADLPITNPYCDSITITSLSFSDSSHILLTIPKTPFTIKQGATVHEKISLLANSSGVFSDSMTISFILDGVAFSTVIPITITAKKELGTILFPARSLPFGTINICKPKSQIFTFTNPHCYDITISKIDWYPASPDFTVINSPTTPFILKPGTTDTITVKYAPSATGFSSALLRIRMQYDGRNYDTLISVSGTASASAICSLSEPQMNFDTVSTCVSLTKQAYLINDNCDSILITQFQGLTQTGFIKISPPLPIELHSGDSLLITITYSPKTSGASLDSISFLGKTNTGNSQIVTLVLSGIGSDQGVGILSVSPKQFTFKSLSICSHDSANGFIANIGCDSLHLDPAKIFGDPDYQVSGIGGQALGLKSGDTLKYNVYLNPAQKGLRQGYIVLSSTVNAIHDTIPFTVTVTDGTRILTTSTNGIDFGTTTVCDPQKDTSFTLRNSGCDTLEVLGVGGLLSGFGTDTKFPIIILPGKDTIIHVFTLLDTSGGKTSNSAMLTFTSNSDNTLSPITLSRVYTASQKVNAGLFLDPAAKTGSDQNTVSYNIKQSPGKPFLGTGIKQVTFDLIHNTNLLEFNSAKSSPNLTSADGKSFTISGLPEITADASGILASIGFNIYLTKDSVTTITLANVKIGAFDTLPCQGIATLSYLSDTALFNYNFFCGERSIYGFLNGVMPMKIISIRPNPAQDEIQIDLESAIKQDANIEIRNALGACVYSGAKNLVSGPNSIHLDTKGLASGMYLVRVGDVSKSLVISR